VLYHGHVSTIFKMGSFFVNWQILSILNEVVTHNWFCRAAFF